MHRHQPERIRSAGVRADRGAAQAGRPASGVRAVQPRYGNRRLQGLTEQGSPLPGALRARLERAFGDDLSAVRLHVGARAAAVGALACTQGSDIHFGPGEYRPDTPDGQALIGHELTHVLQQRTGRVGAGLDPDAGLEREAHETGLRVARGERVSPTVAGPSAGEPAAAGPAPVQRTPKWLKKILRGAGVMNPYQHPGGGNITDQEVDDFVAAYENARFYHGTSAENARSIHATGLLDYEDRMAQFGHDVVGMSLQGGKEFVDDEKKGVYMGRRGFMEEQANSLPDNIVRLFLPADRAVVHHWNKGGPAHQLVRDQKFAGADGGGLIAQESVPARQTHFGKMKKLARTGGDRLDSILDAVGTHYPDDQQPTSLRMAALLDEAIRRRRLSNAALDVAGRGARPAPLR